MIISETYNLIPEIKMVVCLNTSKDAFRPQCVILQNQKINNEYMLYLFSIVAAHLYALLKSLHSMIALKNSEKSTQKL